ncbi:hypothetical protein ACOSP7_007436 [Xanthoceras sorbifolium]
MEMPSSAPPETFRLQALALMSSDDFEERVWQGRRLANWTVGEFESEADFGRSGGSGELGLERPRFGRSEKREESSGRRVEEVSYVNVEVVWFR